MSWRRIIDSSALAIALIAALGVVYVVCARVVLHGIPFSGDEYSAFLQSELFAHGHLKAPAPAHAEWLGIDHVIIDQWVRSKYPPGASVFLSVGQWFGAPWLITPLEGTITLAVLWRTVKKLLGARPALVAILVVGLSPLFIATTTSFYAHTPALMLLTGAFATITSWLYTRRDLYLVLTGCLVGATFLVRPFDALLFGVAMVSLRSWRALVLTGLAALPFVGLTLWYQYAQFGSPFVTGYDLYKPTYLAIYGGSYNSIGLEHFLDGHQQENHFDILKAMLYGSTVLGTPLLAIVGARKTHDGPVRAICTLCVALIVLFVLALLFTLADVDDGPRARYLTTTLVPIAILCARAMQRVWAAEGTKLVAAGSAVLAVLAVVFALRTTKTSLDIQAFRIWHRSGPLRLAERIPKSSVVIVRAGFPTRYARNGPFFDGVLFLSVPANVTDDEVRAAYPDRPVFTAREAQPWKFRRLQ